MSLPKPADRADAYADPAPARRRNRVPVSCGPCRNKKLRCSRGQPCDKCIKNSDISSCTYAAPVTKRRGTGPVLSPDEMRTRVDRLENLVLSLASKGQHGSDSDSGPASARTSSSSARPAASRDADLDKVVNRLGMIRIVKDKSVFVPESHWFALLGELSEVKKYLSEHEDECVDRQNGADDENQVEHPPGTLISSGIALPASKQDLLRSFPPKPLADALLGRYFESYYPALHFIHKQTFYNEYGQFWRDPEQASWPWLALVFAMMSVALHSFHRSKEEPAEIAGQALAMFKSYRVLCAQCILKTDLCYPEAPLVEAFVLHIYAETLIAIDVEPGMFQLVAMAVRTAMRMGYHIDPSAFPGLGPFQAEMRRRTWTLVRHFDIAIATQIGLPPVIRSIDTNTELPTNLFDDELVQEGAGPLPPGRPYSDTTPATYMILKAALVRLFGMAHEMTQSVAGQPSYDDVLALDRRLDEYASSLPPKFSFLTAPPDSLTRAIFIQRTILRHLFYRSRLLLHRRWMTLAITHSQYTYSRRAGIDASLELLKIQSELFDAFFHSGRSNMAWNACTFTQTDFFAAAMTIAWDLHVIGGLEKDRYRLAEQWSAESVSEMVQNLEKSVYIWDHLQSRSLDAFRAYSILRVTIPIIKESRGMKPSTPVAAKKPDPAPDTPAQTAASAQPMPAHDLDSPPELSIARDSSEQSESTTAADGLLEVESSQGPSPSLDDTTEQHPHQPPVLAVGVDPGATASAPKLADPAVVYPDGGAADLHETSLGIVGVGVAGPVPGHERDPFWPVGLPAEEQRALPQGGYCLPSGLSSIPQPIGGGYGKLDPFFRPPPGVPADLFLFPTFALAGGPEHHHHHHYHHLHPALPFAHPVDSQTVRMDSPVGFQPLGPGAIPKVGGHHLAAAVPEMLHDGTRPHLAVGALALAPAPSARAGNEKEAEPVRPPAGSFPGAGHVQVQQQHFHQTYFHNSQNLRPLEGAAQEYAGPPGL